MRSLCKPDLSKKSLPPCGLALAPFSTFFSFFQVLVHARFLVPNKARTLMILWTQIAVVIKMFLSPIYDRIFELNGQSPPRCRLSTVTKGVFKRDFIADIFLRAFSHTLPRPQSFRSCLDTFRPTHMPLNPRLCPRDLIIILNFPLSHLLADRLFCQF